MALREVSVIVLCFAHCTATPFVPLNTMHISSVELFKSALDDPPAVASTTTTTILYRRN